MLRCVGENFHFDLAFRSQCFSLNGAFSHEIIAGDILVIRFYYDVGIIIVFKSKSVFPRALLASIMGCFRLFFILVET
jgi:hypothetical protein